jgi:hypothetical protein
MSACLVSKNAKTKIYTTIILPVVLSGCESWSLTLREEYRPSVFESKVVKKIFGPKRDEMIGDWRKVLHNLCSLPDRMIKSRRIRCAGDVACMEKRYAGKILAENPEWSYTMFSPDNQTIIMAFTVFEAGTFTVMNGN